MDTENLLKELEQLFQEVLKKGSVILTVDTTANDVEGWDSSTNMLLISAIEKKYTIHFGFREIVKLKKVGDLCNAIILKSK